MNEQTRSLAPPSEFRRGIILTSGGSIISLVALFAETLLSARLLDPQAFGTYILLVTIVNFLALVVDFGVKTAITKLIAAGDSTRQAALANNVLLLRLLTILLVSALIWPARGLLVMLDPSLEAYLVYLPLMLLGISFDELLLSMLQGFRVYTHMTVAQILRSVLRLGLSALFLLVFDQGMTGLIYAWILSFLVSVAYQLIVLPVSRGLRWEGRLVAETLRFSFPLYLTYFLSFAVGRADVVLLGALAGPASVAFYAVATRIPDALDRLAASYIAVFFPTMAAMMGRGQYGAASQLLGRSLRLLSFATALIALVGVLFNQQIMTFLFDAQYAASGWAFAALIVGFHIIFSLNLMGYALTAAGKPMHSFGASFVQAVVNIAGNLLLIPVLGFVGPALARALAGYVASGVAIWMLRRGPLMVVIAPHIRQTLLLVACAGWFWWAQPAHPMASPAIIVLFVGASFALSTISWRDLRLVLPERWGRDRALVDVDSGHP